MLGERGGLLGGTGLHRIDCELRRFEIGFWIRASAEGQGYVSEAVQAMTALAFDQLDARRVQIRSGSDRCPAALPDLVDWYRP